MKKLVLILILSLSLGMFTACNSKSTDTSDLQKQIAELESENEDLKSQIEESSKQSADIETESISESHETVNNEKSNDKFSDIRVQIIDKVNHEKDIHNGQYTPFVELVYQVTNNTDKEIKGIQGVLHINDMFDENILNMNFDLTSKSVPANQSITVNNFGLDINEFLDEHTKLYNTDYDKLIFKYEFSKVIFSDGSKIETD